jgi:GNAT superfamily N-acetyltransferase
MPQVTVTRTYLELSALSQLQPAKLDDDLLRLARVPVPSVPLAQRLYRDVGEAYHWVDRWTWSAQQWEAWVRRPSYGTWILTCDGDLAGFFDLHWQEDGACEVELFGLVRQYHGRGMGKHLLTLAVEIAFAIGAARVWLHTCTLDDPAALPNYLARGFQPVKTEIYETELA